ncbi:hypothetical protein BH09PAT2_BH09PAT2_11110 [soil metagenome]
MMVFLIKNTQNRDSRAFHLKLDELIYSMKGARNQLVNAEEMKDEDLEKLQKNFEKVQHRAENMNKKATKELKKRKKRK